MRRTIEDLAPRHPRLARARDAYAAARRAYDADPSDARYADLVEARDAQLAAQDAAFRADQRGDILP